MGWLFLLFVALPLLDLWLLLAIGELLGFWPTVGMTVAIALFGAYMGKREGRKVISQWRQAMSELRMPEEGLVSAALVLVGSVLLVTPGVITDTFGLLLLFPPTRGPIAKFVRKSLEGRMKRAVERGSIRVNVVTLQSSVSASFVPDGDIIDSEAIASEVIDTEGHEVAVEPKALPAHRES